MIHKTALLAQVAILVAAGCGSETPNAADDEQTASEETTSNEPVASSELDLRAGRGGFVARGPRGGVVAGRGGYVAGGRYRHGVYGGRGAYAAGYRRGWVGGSWAPGWGWSHGAWVAGGAAQYTCVIDTDCVGPLGAGVAVCSYDPTVALGYCVAPNW